MDQDIMGGQVADNYYQNYFSPETLLQPRKILQRPTEKFTSQNPQAAAIVEKNTWADPIIAMPIILAVVFFVVLLILIQAGFSMIREMRSQIKSLLKIIRTSMVPQTNSQ